MSIFTPFLKISKFVGDAAGLEKTLRLLQNICQIIVAYSISLNTSQAPWMQARKQMALGRRYLRILKFTDAFTLAFSSINGNPGLLAYLQFGKYSCLGMYLILESATILDTMGVYPMSWAGWVFVEAMKFWFYALCMSMLISLIQLSQLYGKSKVDLNEKLTAKQRAHMMKQDAMKARRKRNVILRRLATDAFDIWIPGTITGWLATSFEGVGWVGIGSTVLAGWDVWVRIQSN